MDALVALALLAAAAIPLLQVFQAGAAGVRPRESDLVVGNLAMDLLERLAADPDGPDPLRKILAADPELDGAALVRRTEAFVGPVPEEVAATVARIGLVVEVRRQVLDLGRPYLDASQDQGLEVWTAKARWRVGGRTRARRFIRISAAR